MTNLTQNLANPNKQPLTIGEFSIRQDEDGRYCLNDLHKASGYDKKHQPAYFIRNQQTKDLIVEIVNSANLQSLKNDQIEPVKKMEGAKGGTYVVKELVYSYAMWISAKFHLMVIRAYDSLVMEWVIGGKQTISPQQADVLYSIIHTRANGNGGIIKGMWSRLKNHFKYNGTYRELRAIHFEDAKHYLEMMELKVKAEQPKSDKIEVDKHYYLSVQGLACHMLWVNRWWKEFGDAIRVISPKMAGAVNDHFTDGACFAFNFIDKNEFAKQKERMEYYQWHLSCTERMALDYRK